MRAEEGQGQQGHHRLEHHVHRGPVPEVPESSLEVPQDGRQQVVRVHARDPRGCSGKASCRLSHEFESYQPTVKLSNTVEVVLAVKDSFCFTEEVTIVEPNRISQGQGESPSS